MPGTAAERPLGSTAGRAGIPARLQYGRDVRLRAPTDTEDEDEEPSEAENGETEPADEPEGGGAGEKDDDVEERFLVRFMTRRDPTLLTEFVNPRVIGPGRRTGDAATSPPADGTPPTAT